MIAPWSASWTAEDEYDIRPCRWVGGKLAIWSPHRPQQGKPIFAKPHMVRQRRSIAEMRCTVCGELTVDHDRWWFGLGEAIKVNGRHWWATTEATVHHACAALALRVCPHLRELNVRPEPFPFGARVLSAIVGGMATERDYGVTIRDRKVIGHLKLAWPSVPDLPMALS